LAVRAILDHVHPLKPPSVFILSGDLPLPKNALNYGGSVDVFCADHHWDPNAMTADVVVAWLEEMLTPIVGVEAPAAPVRSVAGTRAG
jgi:hypothetical protein